MRRNRKKRSSAQRNKLGISLFPFLAVLICTLGVLIMMLVMAVKAADDQVRQTQVESDAQQQAEIDELESIRDLRLTQIDGLAMVRPEALERLSESRANRSHIEEQIRKIKREFRSVGAELLKLDGESKQIAQLNDTANPELPGLPQFEESDETEQKQAIEKLKSEIARAQKRLEAKRDSAPQSGPSRYVIVPHKGGGGTFRRPIFVECTGDAITLQPSGIRLAKSEFAPPLEPGNMLDSALLTIREYWRRYDLAGDQGSPYPLIVVRPGGAETFVLARHAMKSWDDEFGYELVEAGTRLEYGVKDEQLEAEVREAILDARARQRIASYRHRRPGGGQPGSDASGFSRARRRSRSQRDALPGLMADGRGGFVSNAAHVSNEGSSVDYSQELDQSYDSTASGKYEEVSSFAAKSNQSDYQADFSQQRSSESQAASSMANASAGPASSNSAAHGNQAGDSSLQSPYAEKALVKERGRDWALPTQTPGATGYVRPIRVVCSQDVLEIFAGTTSKRIPMTGDTANAIDPLIDEIWAQIDQWGVPGANAYWKPQLRFRIVDGGSQRFLELEGLLYKSGLTLTSSSPVEQQR